MIYFAICGAYNYGIAMAMSLLISAEVRPQQTWQVSAMAGCQANLSSWLDTWTQRLPVCERR